jgi:hypothetical protein
MALPNNTLATYEAIGNREDLSDEIYRIDPTDTPIMTALERTTATAVNHEWQTQALAVVDTANAVLEGDDATTDAVTPTVRLGNICQISDKVARVSGTQQVVQHAGRGRRARLRVDAQGPGAQARHGRHPLSAPIRQECRRGRYGARDGLDPVMDQDQHVQGHGWRRGRPVRGSRRQHPHGRHADRVHGNPAEDRPVRIWTSGGKPDTIFTGAFNKQDVLDLHGPRVADRETPAPRRSRPRSMPTRATSAPSRSSRTASSAPATCWCSRPTCGRSRSSRAARWSAFRWRKPASDRRRSFRRPQQNPAASRQHDKLTTC